MKLPLRADCPITRARVEIRLLKQSVPDNFVLTGGLKVKRLHLDVGEYRAMHREIGGDYLWWFMADASDADIAMHLTLNYPMGVYKNNRMIGFFEIDGITNYPDARINYLGLKTKYLGKGLGKHLINAAIGWAGLAAGPGGSITLTTNDADHMNALPAYFHAGFEQEKSWIEIWNIPDHLGFHIRNDLRVA